MIYGLGLDLCKIDRIEKAIARERFIDRVYTAREGARIRVQVKNKLVSGAEVEALIPKRAAIKFIAQDLKDTDGNSLEAAAIPDSFFTLPAPEGIEAGDFLRIRKEEN